MTPERIEREREAFERFLFKKFELDYDDLEMRDVYFRRRKNGEYLNDTFTEKFDIWLARAAQSEWISVKDRPPESSKRYLTFNSFYMKIVTAYYSVDRRMWLGVCRTDKITHWQPFPAPPTTNPAA